MTTMASTMMALDTAPTSGNTMPDDGKDSRQRENADHVESDAGLHMHAYRPVRSLPYELRDHIRVFFEERMYTEAIHLLLGLLAAGGTSNDVVTRAWVPPPSQLALIATLAVHPAYTTRPLEDAADRRMAGHALQYLRHVLAVVGPVQANLTQAFSFVSADADINKEARAAQRRRRGRPPKKITSHASQTSSSIDSRRNPRRTHQSTGSGGFDNAYVSSESVELGDDGEAMAKWGENAIGGGDGRLSTGMTNDEMAGGGDEGASDAQLLAAATAVYTADEDAVASRMATRDSVWMCGGDVWRVAAWALGCGVRAPARWRVWRPWLTFLVEVLEADVATRLAEEARLAEDDDRRGEPLAGSLLLQYVAGWQRHTQLRQIAAAIVTSDVRATTTASSHGPIFNRETDEVVGGGQGGRGSPSALEMTPTTRRILELDSNMYQDSEDDDDEGEDNDNDVRPASPTRESAHRTKPWLTRRARAREDRTAPIADDSGGADVPAGDHPAYRESLMLRRRILYLVGVAATLFSDDFAGPDAVYRAVAEVLRETDVSVYAAFVGSLNRSLNEDSTHELAAFSGTPSPAAVFAGVLRHVLHTYLPATAPKPRSVDAGDDADGVPSVNVLVRCFLPFAANAVLLGTNVRMALAVESLFRVVWMAKTAAAGSMWSPELQEAAEEGVRARTARVRVGKGRTRRKLTGTAAETAAADVAAVETLGQTLLQQSGTRLLAMVQLARMEGMGKG